MSGDIDVRLKDVARIAVLRANAIGDYILTLPALDALRATYPEAHISLLGSAWHRQFLDGRPGAIDEVIVAPLRETARHADFFRQMRDRSFDLAIQLHGGGRVSNPFVARLGARCSAGFATANAYVLDRVLPYQPGQPVVLHLLECVALVGARQQDLQPRLRLTAADHCEASRVLEPQNKPLVILQPGASDPRRRWSTAKFAQVGDALAQSGATIAINGAANEQGGVNAVAARMRHPALVLSGRLGVGGLAALMTRARVVIGNDSGPLHLARAVGAPTVTLIWIGNLHSYGPLSSVGNRVLVSWQLECPVCGARNVAQRCGHDVSFVDAIEADAVLAAAAELSNIR